MILGQNPLGPEGGGDGDLERLRACGFDCSAAMEIS
jgi:hypothetical protein